jgi:non-homologous end joining protein Ku
MTITFKFHQIDEGHEVCIRSIKAESMRSAVINGHRYVKNYQLNVGKVTIFEDGEVIRVDERSARTGYKWQTVE